MITAERGAPLESEPLADDVISCRQRAGRGGEAAGQETLLLSTLFSLAGFKQPTALHRHGG